MPLAIFLRSDVARNRFRDVIIDVLNAGSGQEAIICSGFFQELYRSSYQVSQEKDFAKVLARTTVRVTTIGLHSYGWLAAYEDFCDSLRSAGVALNATIANQLKWHAKVFLLSKAGVPFFGVIGSSNLTRPAFSTSWPFNYEADVVIWSEKAPHVGQLVRGLVAAAVESPYEVILASYDPGDNHGLTLDDRLVRLDAELRQVPVRSL